MNILLDTQLLLWSAGEKGRLSSKATDLIASTENEIYFSVASLWEIVIKAGLGRDDFQVDPSAMRRNLIGNGFVELGIEASHVLAVSSLPVHHKDPFDRLLVAQAAVEGLTFVTTDRILARYSTSTIEV